MWWQIVNTAVSVCFILFFNCTKVVISLYWCLFCEMIVAWRFSSLKKKIFSYLSCLDTVLCYLSCLYVFFHPWVRLCVARVIVKACIQNAADPVQIRWWLYIVIALHITLCTSSSSGIVIECYCVNGPCFFVKLFVWWLFVSILYNRFIII